MEEISVLNLFLQAGIVVKIVMILLFVASILSWIVIVERYKFFRKVKNENNIFLKKFWSGKDLSILYKEIQEKEVLYGSMNLFKNSFDEFHHIESEAENVEVDLESINRTMRTTSGKLVLMLFAIDCNNMVFPVLGGATISPR